MLGLLCLYPVVARFSPMHLDVSNWEKTIQLTTFFWIINKSIIMSDLVVGTANEQQKQKKVKWRTIKVEEKQRIAKKNLAKKFSLLCNPKQWCEQFSLISFCSIFAILCSQRYYFIWCRTFSPILLVFLFICLFCLFYCWGLVKMDWEWIVSLDETVVVRGEVNASCRELLVFRLSFAGLLFTMTNIINTTKLCLYLSRRCYNMSFSI